MIRRFGLGLTTLLLCTAAPVLAGEEPLYQAPPAWVTPVELTDAQVAKGPTIVLADVQKRLDGAKVWDYRDFAFRIDNPETLTAGGTIAASWIPDKGDLMINRVEILRGAERVDVLAKGARFTVLRREQQLEQRSIDGMLTATLAVPGLRVGDVLRLAYTTVQADQALGDNVQSVESLPSAPFDLGYGRVRVSWPEKAAVSWRAGPSVDLPEPEVKDGFKTIDVTLPLAERADIPQDAPGRYRREPMLQVGSFASWQEVSSALAPHFATEGTIAAKGEIAGKIAAIEKQSKDPLTRASLALRIVQDEISYLANGLNGGNYLPQKPEETWLLRYGDCKAKTMLLLAMLREMGIEADPVVVHSSLGDSAPSLLPMPADFDHVIVRARIAGQDYWLDGTSSGARMANIAEVPPFFYGLPLTTAGSDLVALAQRPVTQIDQMITLELDQSAGVDMPSLFKASIELSGAYGANIRPLADQQNEIYREAFIQKLVTSLIGPGSVIDYTVSYDDETGKGTVVASGLLFSQWQFERGIAREALPALPAADFTFTADRARAAWKDIPVQMPGPYILAADVKLILPDGGKGYSLRGREVMNTEFAGATITRDAAITGDTLRVKEQLSATMVEIAPGAIAAEKAKAQRFSGKLSLLAPADAKRVWDVAGADRARLAPIEAAYQKLIDKDPEDSSPYLQRAYFRAQTLDWAGAIADTGKGLEVQPTSAAYLARSFYLNELNRKDEALADVRSAFDLEPSAGNALAEANALAELGRYDEALELVEGYEEDAETHVSALMTKAQILGMAGRGGEGLALLDQLLVERPGDPGLLNGICWQMGAWNLRPDSVLQSCTKAVESADWSPPVLDSRAMAYFRLGRLEDALADYNAALTNAPGLAPTLYMRGIVRTKIGDKDGATDIAKALRMSPSLKATYARYGIEAPGG